MKIIEKANNEVIEKIKEARPYLINVVLAKDVIKEFEKPTLLHAGPPITWENMVDPIKGSCIGALIFEGLANNEKEAISLMENGEVNLISCHSVGAVGPMGGITSANMAVLVVENKITGKKSYCNLNEGIGKVLRFGAYSSEVIERLKWIRNTLRPILNEALMKMPDGLDLNSIVAKAITMGDEFHQRNIAASNLFLKEILPFILETNDKFSLKEIKEVTKFLGDTDQFFLNIMMAFCKSVMDYAATTTEGTIVTALSRNGYEFGIKVSGLGDKWYTAPVNTPEGLFFTGYTQEDACADMGDSAITETFGVGAMAMIASPGVTRFVGAGGFEDALQISEMMQEICISNNNNYSIPTWDFKGTCLGIDVRKVVETGITPIINTGIAHKKAGIGQVGAGTVRVPIECFEKALKDLHKKYVNMEDK